METTKDTQTEDQRADRIRRATVKFVPNPASSRQWNSELRWTILTEQTVKACQEHGLSFERYMEIMNERADAKFEAARSAN